MAMTLEQRDAALVSMVEHYRGAMAEILIGAMVRVRRAPLVAPGIGTIAPLELVPTHVADRTARFVYALPTLPGIAAGRTPRLPIVFPRAPDGEAVIWIRTREEWGRVIDAWHARVSGVASHMALAMQSLHDEMDVVAGVTPILDAEGRTLTGRSALEAREARFAELSSGYFRDRPGELDKRLALGSHPSAGALSTSLAEAREQLLDQVDEAADETRRWLLDDPSGTGAGPADAAQEAELRRLEVRRQEGRRTVRQATSVPAAATAARLAMNLIRGAGIESAPLFRGAPFATDLPASLSLAYAAPETGRWSHALRLVQPPKTVTGEEPTLLGGIALDRPDAPAGWTVTDAARSAPNAHERDLTIAWAGEGEPAAGAHVLEITARNRLGPRRLTVTITVPASGESA